MDLPDTPDLDALVHFAKHGPHVLRQYNMLYEALAARDSEIAQHIENDRVLKKLLHESEEHVRSLIERSRRDLAQRDARIAELEAMNTSRLEDVAVLLKAFDDGLFVRDTKGDGDPRWAIKLLTPLAAMARLQRTIDAALAAAKGE